MAGLQVVIAAEGKIPVFLDGGVRRGTDVLKALALGAQGVFVSTLPKLALAQQSYRGVILVAFSYSPRSGLKSFREVDVFLLRIMSSSPAKRRVWQLEQQYPDFGLFT